MQITRLTTYHKTALRALVQGGVTGVLLTYPRVIQTALELCGAGYAEYIQSSPYYGCWVRITDAGRKALTED